jgi:hypothetical protein
LRYRFGESLVFQALKGLAVPVEILFLLPIVAPVLSIGPVLTGCY